MYSGGTRSGRVLNICPSLMNVVPISRYLFKYIGCFFLISIFNGPTCSLPFQPSFPACAPFDLSWFSSYVLWLFPFPLSKTSRAFAWTYPASSLTSSSSDPMTYLSSCQTFSGSFQTSAVSFPSYPSSSAPYPSSPFAPSSGFSPSRPFDHPSYHQSVQNYTLQLKLKT